MSHTSVQRRWGVLAAALLSAVLGLTTVPLPASAASDPVMDQVRAVRDWRGANSSSSFASTAATSDQVEAPESEVVPGSFLVTLTDEAAGLGSFDAAGYDRSTELAPGVLRIDVDVADADQAAADLAARTDVASVEPNRIREFLAVPNDEFYGQQWAHQLTGIESAWDATTGSPDVLVALADSGVVASHSDIAGIVEQVDAGTGEIRPGAVDNDVCKVGHGTWTAGVLGAAGNNTSGVAGVNWDVGILDINTADPEVSCAGPTDSGTVAAIAYATQQGADVVNLSLGGPGTTCPTAMQNVIDQAIAAGTVVVASSGNGGDATPNVPGSCNGAISVGAVGPDSTVAPYSTFNPGVDLVAPGGAGADEPSPATEILTTSFYSAGEETGEYALLTGTSFAAPYVSGMVALMRATAPDLTPADIESLLESTATDVGDAGRDDASGWGLVQGAAVIQAAAGGDIPAPEPDPDFPVGEDSAPTPGDRPGGDIEVFRVSDGSGTTVPVPQAVAVSQSVFADAGTTTDGIPTAQWAVIARDDDYADALAGSSLTLGAAPLLFTGSSGPLAASTATELTRTLEPGSNVYLLGGVNALPATLDAEVIALGFSPVRLAGAIREDTAVEVADEVDRILVDVIGVEPSPVVLLVNREDWPDAVAAGLLGAQFGYPILLTPPDNLAPQTAAALEARDVAELVVVGGTVRVSDSTMNAALDLTQAPEAQRLAGEERNGTVAAVSTAVEAILGQAGAEPTNALAVNVRRDDAYAHMLSATVPAAAFTAVFVSVEEPGGTSVPTQARDYATGLGLPTGLMGGPDLIADATGAELEAIIETTP